MSVDIARVYPYIQGLPIYRYCGKMYLVKRRMEGNKMKKLRIMAMIIFAVTALTMTSFASSDTTLLKVGSRGDAVSQVQQELLNRGYFNHSVTGYYGNITKSAVIEFQKDNKIGVDGIVGTQTRGKLFGNEYNSTDLYWLSRIIHAEARGESYKGKVAVGNTILNRVKSNDFPNTVKGVVFDRKYGVQYTPVANGTIYNEPDQNSINAAKDAMNGVNYAGKSLYFYNPVTAPNAWAGKNRPFYASIGNHNFHL